MIRFDPERLMTLDRELLICEREARGRGQVSQPLGRVATDLSLWGQVSLPLLLNLPPSGKIHALTLSLRVGGDTGQVSL